MNRILAAFFVAIATACATNDAKPTPSDQASASAGVVSEAGAQTPARNDTTTSPAAVSSTSALGGDSIKVAIPVGISVKGRSKKDSLALVSAIRAGMKDTRWPVKGPAPLPGSIFPGSRIIAFYGNPLSKKMGVLGEYSEKEMLAKLDRTTEEWRKSDPSVRTIQALHVIAVVAQGAPGRDGKYKLRMADTLLEKIYNLAHSRTALTFVDLQVGKSTVSEEVPRLEQFLKRPDVHLGLDPEFSMKFGDPPGKKIGTMSAADINFAIDYLAKLVTANHLPPKVLVVHRFTRPMITNYKAIKLDPRVQVVIDMDGWGAPWLKYDSYRDYVAAEPVQYTGFKIFYHNDTKSGEPILTPAEVLLLTPKPVYIQYQ